MESNEGARDWQEGCFRIGQRGAHLLRTELWADCVFLVGAGQRERVLGHRLLLAMASPVFERMFYGALAAGIAGVGGESAPIEIPDLKPEAFKALLKYIYTDSTDFGSFDDACDLYYAARKYLLPHLAKQCLEYMSEHISPQNACRSYELAQLFELDDLKKETLEIMRTRTKAVLASDSFVEAQLSTVVQLFSLEELELDSELQLLGAAERYARAQGAATGGRGLDAGADDEKENVTNSAEDNGAEAALLSSKSKRRKARKRNCEKSDEATPHSQSKQISINKNATLAAVPGILDAVRQIRFLTLTPQQFAQGAASSALLTREHASAIRENINSGTHAAMPSGFSMSRKPRTKTKDTGTFQFTVNVDHIRAINDLVYSPSHLIRNMVWRLRICSDVLDKDNLNICLKCDGIKGNQFYKWTCPATGTLKLLSHKPDAEPMTWDFKKDFSEHEDEIGCLEEYIEWSEVLNPENGFLKDRTITVEVDLCVGELRLPNRSTSLRFLNSSDSDSSDFFSIY